MLTKSNAITSVIFTVAVKIDRHQHLFTKRSRNAFFYIISGTPSFFSFIKCCICQISYIPLQKVDFTAKQ
jgi:hypothetical protein